MNPIFRVGSRRSHLSQKTSGINLKFAMMKLHTAVRNRITIPNPLTILVNWIGPLLSLSVAQCPGLKTATSQSDSLTLSLINVNLFSVKAEIYAVTLWRLIFQEFWFTVYIVLSPSVRPEIYLRWVIPVGSGQERISKVHGHIYTGCFTT
jgi:hypothetical protein